MGMAYTFKVRYYDNREYDGVKYDPVFYEFQPGIPIVNQLADVRKRLKCPQKIEDLSLEVGQWGPNLDLNSTIEEQAAKWKLHRDDDDENTLHLCTKPSLVLQVYLEKLRRKQETLDTLEALRMFFEGKRDDSLVEEFIKADGLECLLECGRNGDERQRYYTLLVLYEIVRCPSGRMGVLHFPPKLLGWVYSQLEGQNHSNHRLQAVAVLHAFMGRPGEGGRVKHLANAIDEEDKSKGRKPWILLKGYMDDCVSSGKLNKLKMSLDLINSVLRESTGTSTFSEVVQCFEAIGMDTFVKEMKGHRHKEVDKSIDEFVEALKAGKQGGATSDSSKHTEEAAEGISGLGADAEKIYEEACKTGTVPVNRCRLIVVGQDGAGKSCFVDSLLDRPFKRGNPSTKGVAIHMAVTAAEARRDGDVWAPCGDYQGGHYLDRYIAAGYVITKGKPEGLKKEIHEEQHRAAAVTAEINESSGVRKLKESLDEPNASSKLFVADFDNSDPTELDKCIDELVRKLTLTEEQRRMIREYIESDEALGSLKECEVSMKLLWDLGGQERYLTTHAALMPKESVFTVCKYFLLVNMSKSLGDKAESFFRVGAGNDDEKIKLNHIECNRDFVRHWLSSIALAHAGSHPQPYLGQSLKVKYPAVFIGGTFMDEVLKMPDSKEILKEQNAELEKVIKNLECQDHIFKRSKCQELFPHILEVSEDEWFFPIDNTKSGQGDKPRCQGVKAIRTAVDSSSKKYWLEKNILTPMPVAWLRFELLLVRWRLGKVISLETAKKLARRSNINSEEEAEVALKFLYGLGVIFYFWNVPSLAGSVIVDPLWLVRAVAAATPIVPPSRLEGPACFLASARSLSGRASGAGQNNRLDQQDGLYLRMRGFRSLFSLFALGFRLPYLGRRQACSKESL
eukprot:m.293778 g.293778  ORF g.293778 m.293778 type:complete len:906 (+) comp40741_c2_seq2:3-2720(+)